MRFRYEECSPMAGMRTYGCLGCSPVVAGAVLIGVGVAFQTGWAADAATFLLRAMGYVLMGMGGLLIVLAVVGWFVRRRSSL